MLVIDGSYGEGGGQVVRTTLALAALTGQAVRLEKIRAGRKNPGLQAQHLTSVLAAAQVCQAEVEGARLGSTTLAFAPRRPPQAGHYRFDVAEQRQGGSAGSVTLVLHTLLLPLAWAEGPSRVTVCGGTHVAWSPPFQHLEQAYLPMLRQLGIEAQAQIRRWGWYPQGGGEVTVEIAGRPGRETAPLELLERGQVQRLAGLSAASNLPAHVAERQARRVEQLLHEAGLSLRCAIVQAPAAGPGSAVFLAAAGDGWAAGFSALGARGKPAERVAEEACTAFLRWWRSGAALEMHLADQLLLPLALTGRPAAFSTCRVTQHLLTNAWVIQQLLPVRITVEGAEGDRGTVRLRPP